MNTILVATDFSPAAQNASAYAASLAARLGASLHLVHIYQIPVNLSETPMLVVSADEIQHNVDQYLKRAEDELRTGFPQLQITTESRLGALNDELNEICRTTKPSILVVGNEDHSAVEDFFFGKTALSVLRHSTLPVLLVPAGTGFTQLTKMALATDLSDTGKFPFEKTKAIASFMGTELNVVHIQTDDDEQVSGLNELATALNAKGHVMRHKDFVEGILQYCRENGIDLLAIVPHKLRFFERLFSRKHTNELVEKISIPILAIPE